MITASQAQRGNRLMVFLCGGVLLVDLLTQTYSASTLLTVLMLYFALKGS